MLSTLRSARFLMLLTMIALVALVGCGGDDDPTVPNGGGDVLSDGSSSCTIDGSAKTYDENGAGVADGNGWLILSASNATGLESIVLKVSDTAGTYSLDVIGENGVTFTGTAGVYLTSGGTLTVSSVSSSHVTGTFSGTAANPIVAGDTIVITNGTFDFDIASMP